MSNCDITIKGYGKICDYNHYGDHSEIRPYNTYAEAKEYYNNNYKKIPEFMIQRLICKTLGLDKPEELSIEDNMEGLSIKEKVNFQKRMVLEEEQDKEFGYKDGRQVRFYYSND